MRRHVGRHCIIKMTDIFNALYVRMISIFSKEEINTYVRKLNGHCFQVLGISLPWGKENEDINNITCIVS